MKYTAWLNRIAEPSAHLCVSRRAASLREDDADAESEALNSMLSKILRSPTVTTIAYLGRREHFVVLLCYDLFPTI